MYDFTKTVEENQKLATEYATKMAAAAFDFNKKVVDATSEVMYAVRDQATAAIKAAGLKVPGLDK